jgi:phosphoglucomutase
MITVDEANSRLAHAEDLELISGAARANIQRWLIEPPLAKYRECLIQDIECERWADLDNAFFTVLEFGTGGRRGKMYPVGTNVLNERTVAESARGLADFVTNKKKHDTPGTCVIAFDTRHRSADFAKVCASVLTAAGLKVFLFREPRATPLLSFAVRYLQCDAGIMITASHNPPSDNGFKCYGRSGAQVIPPDDDAIIACVNDASNRPIPEKALVDAEADGSLVWVDPAVDADYIAAVVDESVCHARKLSIVFTPLHGVGETTVARALRTAGFNDVHIVAAQRTPDGDFPNVTDHIANPEIPRTLERAVAEARGIGADLVIATDPDADRIGIAVPTTRNPLKEWTTLDGNEIGVLLAAFVIKETEAQGRLRSDHYLVSTLVSTQMIRALARREGVRLEYDLLVGFKWIASRIDERGPAGFLFAFEESHGYLKGTYARDKDGSVAALLFAELAAALKDRNQTVLEYLDDLYVDVGHYLNRQVNNTYQGREGTKRIQALMQAFRTKPPSEFGGLKLKQVYDFKEHEIRAVNRVGVTRPLPPRPDGDLLIFDADESATGFAVRPSGTEPKIKFYLFARTEVSRLELLSAAKAKTAARLDAMTRDLEQYVDDVLGDV